MQPTSEAPGANLRNRRLERGMSQDQLAQATGLTKTTIQNLENGRSPGYRHTWQRIAAALGTTVASLREVA